MVELLVLSSLDQLLFILTILLSSFTKSYLIEEVNCTEPSPLVSIPWLQFWHHKLDFLAIFKTSATGKSVINEANI